MEKQKAEAELRQKKDRINKIKDNLATRVVDSKNAFELALRLPNGKKVMHTFDVNDQIQVVHDFVATIEDKGFEDNHHDFSLTAGFPPQVLDLQSTIRSAFPGSHGELVNIKEIHN